MESFFSTWRGTTAWTRCGTCTCARLVSETQATCVRASLQGELEQDAASRCTCWILGCVHGAVRRTNTPTCRASLGVATLVETKGSRLRFLTWWTNDTQEVSCIRPYASLKWKKERTDPTHLPHHACDLEDLLERTYDKDAARCPPSFLWTPSCSERSRICMDWSPQHQPEHSAFALRTVATRGSTRRHTRHFSMRGRGHFTCVGRSKRSRFERDRREDCHLFVESTALPTMEDLQRIPDGVGKDALESSFVVAPHLEAKLSLELWKGRLFRARVHLDCVGEDPHSCLAWVPPPLSHPRARASQSSLACLSLLLSLFACLLFLLHSSPSLSFVLSPSFPCPPLPLFFHVPSHAPRLHHQFVFYISLPLLFPFYNFFTTTICLPP